MDDRLNNGYDHLGSDGDVHQFRLSRMDRLHFEERAVKGAIDVVNRRIRETCLDNVRIEREGSDVIRIHMLDTEDPNMNQCP
ncbi:MAG: hypothetical protein AAFV53_11550 [Myxococcota bacterium]